jgi:hypothetical protein
MPTKQLHQAARHYSPDQHGELQEHGRYDGAKWDGQPEWRPSIPEEIATDPELLIKV